MTDRDCDLVYRHGAWHCDTDHNCSTMPRIWDNATPNHAPTYLEVPA